MATVVDTIDLAAHQIIQYEELAISHNYDIFFRHLKMEIELAIPASNE